LKIKFFLKVLRTCVLNRTQTTKLLAQIHTHLRDEVAKEATKFMTFLAGVNDPYYENKTVKLY
jgi:hypothetical protein